MVEWLLPAFSMSMLAVDDAGRRVKAILHGEVIRVEDGGGGGRRSALKRVI